MSERTYYLSFDKDFKHVALISNYIGGQVRIGIEGLPNKLKVTASLHDLKFVKGSKFLKVKIKSSLQQKRWFGCKNPFHLLNCVGVIKYILGVWPLVWTPKGLYKWLIKQNFVEIL